MKEDVGISFVIPVFNRPAELQELLESMARQSIQDFEVLVVEDGSELKCEDVCKKYKGKLDIKYFFKANSGPGLSRNYGFERAKGNYAIFLDSDCILPPRYFEVVQAALRNEYVDAFGGPDAAHPDFTDFQKAVNYSMTSFFTTGGIRGKSKKLGEFNPRSFNMGISREVFRKTGGFSPARFGEDLDLSLKIKALGFKTALIPEAFVYHKRRTDLKQFFDQVFNFGYARVSLYIKHPTSLKPMFFAPTIFVLGTLSCCILTFFLSPVFFWPIILHASLLFIDSSIKNKDFSIGFLSVVTSYVQLYGYGIGFMVSFWKQIILKRKRKGFPTNRRPLS